MCGRRGVKELIPMQLHREQLPPLCLSLKFYKTSSNVGDFRFAPLPSLVDPGEPKETPHGELHARTAEKPLSCSRKYGSISPRARSSAANFGCASAQGTVWKFERTASWS